MDNTLLQLSTTKFGYGQKVIVQAKSGLIKTGTLNVLIGKNGSGKSTLLRTILGMNPLLEGEIQLKGDDIDSLTALQRARIISAVLAANHQSPDGMKVSEMIALGRSPHTSWWGKLSQRDNQVINESAERAGVSKFLDLPMGKISDGERQKVYIARALAQETDLILLDEPMAFLDFSARREFLKLLQDLCKEGKSILYSSHDLALSLTATDTVWLIDNESQLQILDSDEFSKSGMMEKIFGHQL